MQIIVPIIPPSLNVLKRKYRNVHAYANLRKVWEAGIFLSTGSALKSSAIRAMVKTSKKLKVTIVIQHHGQYDKDNLYGSAKVVLDAMKNIGFLIDDSNDHIDLVVSQVRQIYGGSASTQITLEDLP